MHSEVKDMSDCVRSTVLSGSVLGISLSAFSVCQYTERYDYRVMKFFFETPHTIQDVLSGGVEGVLVSDTPPLEHSVRAERQSICKWLLLGLQMKPEAKSSVI